MPSSSSRRFTTPSPGARRSTPPTAACAPGGWLLLCDEPNWLHTFVSYRVAKLSNTHEIGFTRRQLTGQLRQTGFQEVVIARNRFGFLVKPHWLAAQK